MRGTKQLVASVILKEGMRFVERNPVQNVSKLLDWGEKLVKKEQHQDILNSVRKAWEEEGNWHELTKIVLSELHPKVRNKLLINFFVNSCLAGIPIRDKLAEELGFKLPWTILIDPTAGCNIKCKGCWASEYSKASSLDYNTLDRIIQEGKKIGIYFYLYSGGEPLLRKKDLIGLAKKHDDCAFLAFTNGTLVDEGLAQDIVEAGNLILAFSIEGTEEETDARRGQGTYQKVIKSMDILKSHGAAFGFSACYHSQNFDGVSSDDFVDLMVEKGCLFGWYFTYMPLGKNADLSLLASPEQREHVYRRVRELRKHKPVFLMDFWNDGEYTQGCIAGGRCYLHINANGDVEPCAFIHYSNVNIKDVSLLEALDNPLFIEYQSNQPFNNNHLRPCPLLDNPEMLKKMVNNTCAQSTQLLDHESVEDLTDKCMNVSKRWEKTASRLWQEKEHGADMPPPLK